MSKPNSEQAPSPTLLLLRRELRGAKSLFWLVAVTMAAATAALTLVLSLANAFETTYTDSARTLLGGDLSLRLSQREFNDAELAWLRQNSVALSEIRATRALAVVGERTQIVRLKGVEDDYPNYGELVLREATTPPTAALHGNDGDDGVIPAYVGDDLAILLDLEIGAIFKAGGLTLRVVNFVLTEPDPDPRIWLGAPLVMVAKKHLETDTFMRPGALVWRTARVVLGDETDGEEWQTRLQEEFPNAGWRVQRPDNTQSSTRRIVRNVRDFLALASLAAILLAGLGCGNALSAFLRSRMRAIAVIKMLGGRAFLVRRVYLLVAALFASGGALVGALIGMGAMFILAPIISPYLPVPIQAEWSISVFLRALLTAIAMSAAFAVPPILRFARINPMMLFAASSDEDRTPAADRTSRLVAAAAFLLATVALPLAWHTKILLGGVVAFGGGLYVLTMLVAAAVAKLPLRGGGAWRLGLLAIARNRRQTASGVMSFGVGVFVLVAVLNAESNFSGRLQDALSARAPTLYFVGILPDQKEDLQNIIAERDGELRTIPFLRGRISAISGRSNEELLADAPREERWVLRGDRAFTWSDGDYIGGSRVTEGSLWDENIDGLQASFDEEAAAAFGVELGDALELNIYGEPVTAIISSFREVNWQSFDINFVVILSAPPFADVPHTFMGGAQLADADVAATQLAIGAQLPNVVPIAMTPIFERIRNLMARAAALLQATALFLLVAGMPMTIATLIENRQRRLRHAVTLRLIGIRRRTIIFAGIAEFTVMALLAVLPATLLGALAGSVLVEKIFELEWRAYWAHLGVIVICAIVAFLSLGAADIIRTAKQAPYPLLRNE